MLRWMLIILVLSAMACGDSSPNAPNSRSSAAQTEPPQAVTADLHRALAKLALRSQTARNQLSFYDAMAVPAVYEDDGNVHALTPPTRDQYFFVAVLRSRLPTLREDGPGLFAVFRCSPIPILVLHASSATDLAKGVALAHELEHARDCLSAGGVDIEPMSETWIASELRAHSLVTKVLAEAEGERWTRLVAVSRARRMAQLNAQGASVMTGTVGIADEDVDDLIRFLGPGDDVSMGLLLGQLIIETNIANLLARAQSMGLSDEDLHTFSLLIVLRFYEQFYPPSR